MRLIDTHTHLLLEPWKAAGKEYAILSHTWGADEVVFQEWEQVFPSGAIKGQCPHAARGSGIEAKAGFSKVVQACEQARRDGIRWLWCDTVCINKESSAELSEAINSMFKWYSDAKVCYAYLTDVSFPDRQSHLGLSAGPSNVQGWFLHANSQKQTKLFYDINKRFMGSRWWTRGWTLQELIAPETVVFFSEDWTPLGRKLDLAVWISATTAIHRRVLEDRSSIPDFSIAQRMSWAAPRCTTVVEDMAYCLLGIFGISMPLLYGEGEHAFRKLQEEIIKISDDQSIFAWHVSNTSETPDPRGVFWTGAFATSPANFRLCGSIIFDNEIVVDSIPYTLTNMGVKLSLPWMSKAENGPLLLGLNCSVELRGRNSNKSHKNGAHSTRRRFQISLMARLKQGSIYERGHLATTKFCLQPFYAQFMEPKCHNFYLTARKPTIAPHFDRYHHRMNSTMLGSEHSGITVVVGFGAMREIGHAYLDVWSPAQFSIVSMTPRARSGCSHELVCSGEFTVIISVWWDEHCEPRATVYTVLRHEKPIPGLIENLASSIVYTLSQELDHCHIRSKYSRLVVSGNNAPLVLIDDGQLEDLNGRAEVAVEVIFNHKYK